MSDLWIEPIILPDRWMWFGGLMAFSTLITVIFSPRRRAAIGFLRVALGRASQLVVPLAGVVVVRSGFRLFAPRPNAQRWRVSRRFLVAGRRGLHQRVLSALRRGH